MVAKGLCVRGELKTEQKTATYWPPVPPSLAALLFSFYWAAHPGSLRAQLSAGSGSHYLELQLTDFNFWLHLTASKLSELPVAPGYIIVWRTPASCECHISTQFNQSTVNVIPWYFRLDAPVPWSTAESDVNMLQNDLTRNEIIGGIPVELSIWKYWSLILHVENKKQWFYLFFVYMLFPSIYIFIIKSFVSNVGVLKYHDLLIPSLLHYLSFYP